ncbi:MAG: Lrp/AsnC family transcriptional regulator [Clostridia bacterium]|nr:Lrp/AsnC family transcriptional regulator [Clostridia bacterium]
MLDKTDLEILKLLSENARTQLKDIGEAVHLTGQAVGNRIARMENLGVIKGYTLKLDEAFFGKTITAYVTTFMKTTEHAAFQSFLKTSAIVLEAHRISGDGCYLLKVQAEDQQDLNSFLDTLLAYANYRLNISIDKVK